MNIVYFEVQPWEKKYLKSKLTSHNCKFYEEPLGIANVDKAKSADIISTFVYSDVNKCVISSLKKTKLIVTRSTGFDHIDLKACKKNNIVVSNVPNYGKNTVAEHAMALLLTISRKIVESVERTRRSKFNWDGLTGFDLKNKTMGIVGTGNIGKHTAKFAKGFDMKVLAYDKFPDKDWAKDLGVEYVSLKKLLNSSDVVSLHLPLFESTYHIISKARVKQMKKGCVLINTSRGSLVETNAILMGLDKGYIGYCGLDVLEGETCIKEEAEFYHEIFQRKCDPKVIAENHILMDHDRVIVTPHNAFHSKEALIRILKTTIDDIKSFIKKEPINVCK